MKYLFILAIAVTFFSCKRNYNCHCVFSDSTSKDYKIKEKTTSKAFDKCVEQATEYANSKKGFVGQCEIHSQTP